MNLFSSYRIKNLYIKNRVVLPPMVRPKLIDETGYVTDALVEYYEDRAKCEVGLIIVEAACVDKDAKLRKHQLGIWEDAQIDGLKRVAEACRKYNTPVLLQIHHAGYKENISEIPTEKLDSILVQFIDAFHRAKKAGFDGIEIHGAHRYLISQLNSRILNTRKDKYGGSFENRMRFSRELIKSTRHLFNDDFILGYRMGGNEPGVEDGIKIAKELEKYGVDLLHVSQGVPYPEIKKSEKIEVPNDFPLNWVIYTGTEIKKHVTVPVIVVNLIKEEKDASWLIENGLSDFVAIGRALISRANWVGHAKAKYKERMQIRSQDA